MAETKITVNEIDNSVKSKLIYATRDGTAAGGTVSYTGVGFKPTSIIALMSVDGTLYRSEGFSDPNRTPGCTYQSAANVSYENNSQIITYSNQSGWAQSANVASYDADGFTLTWVKIGAVPAGTMKIKFMCYR